MIIVCFILKQLLCILVIPRFADVVESTVETLSQNPRARIDEEKVIHTSQLVSTFSSFEYRYER